MTEVLFHDLWLRPALAPRDRSLVTLSGLIAAGQVAQITFHLNKAMDNVAPDNPEAIFAGYAIWLGIAQETAISSRYRWPLDVAFLNGGDAYLLGYPLPGSENAPRAGRVSRVGRKRP